MGRRGVGVVEKGVVQSGGGFGDVYPVLVYPTSTLIDHPIPTRGRYFLILHAAMTHHVSVSITASVSISLKSV